MLNRTNIEEANKHLQALYGRINALECITQDQHEAMLAKDSFIQTKVNELAQQDNIIEQQRQQMKKMELELQFRNEKYKTLEITLADKETECDILRKRNESLTQLLNLIPEMKALFAKMEDITASVEEFDESLPERTDSQISSVSAADGDTSDTVKQTIPFTAEVVIDKSVNTSPSFRQAGRQKFSISEDDFDDIEDYESEDKHNDRSSQSTPIKQTKGSKEFYL